MESILNNKLGIIGSSLIAEEHILAFQENDFDVTCIASSNNSKTAHTLAKKYKSVKYFPSVPEMLQEGEYSSLAILSSVESLYSNLIKALDYADYIFIEKPVSLNTSEINKIKSLRNVQVGFNRRYYSSVDKLRSFIEKAEFITGNINFPEEISTTSKSTDKKKLHHEAIRKNSIHIFDLLSYLFGELKVEYKKTIGNKEYIGVEAILSNEICNLYLSSSLNDPSNTSISIFNGQKRAVLRPLEHYTEYEGFIVKDPEKGSKIRIYSPNAVSNNVVEAKKFKPGFYEQSLDFKKLLTGEDSLKRPTLEDSYIASSLIDNLLS